MSISAFLFLAFALSLKMPTKYKIWLGSRTVQQHMRTADAVRQALRNAGIVTTYEFHDQGLAEGRFAFLKFLDNVTPLQP